MKADSVPALQRDSNSAMTKALLILAAMAFAVTAGAQQFKWIDKDGKVRYGDVPPPGVKATRLKPPPPASAPPAAAKGAAKGPLTPAEQEADFKKRQLEAQKDQAKQDQSNKERLAKKDNCDRATEQLRVLDSGRVARLDSKGERYFLDEKQIAQERTKANETVGQNCN